MPALCGLRLWVPAFRRKKKRKELDHRKVAGKLYYKRPHKHKFQALTQSLAVTTVQSWNIGITGWLAMGFMCQYVKVCVCISVHLIVLLCCLQQGPNLRHALQPCCNISMTWVLAKERGRWAEEPIEWPKSSYQLHTTSRCSARLGESPARKAATERQEQPKETTQEVGGWQEQHIDKCTAGFLCLHCL